MKLENLGEAMVSTAVFAGIGLVVFGIAFWLMTRLAPFSIKKEIEEDHNVAFAVILGAVILGVAHIVAATVHG